MSATFQTKFKSQFQTPDDYQRYREEWTEFLHRHQFSDAQLQQAVLRMQDEYEWTPTFAEFKRLCEDAPQDWEHRSAAYRIHDPRRQLKKMLTEEDKQKATKFFAGLKKNLNGEPR